MQVRTVVVRMVGPTLRGLSSKAATHSLSKEMALVCQPHSSHSDEDEVENVWDFQIEMVSL